MDPHSPLRLSYGFVMDGVQPLLNITEMALNLDAVSNDRDTNDNSLISRSTGQSRKVRSPGSFSALPKYLTIYPDPELNTFTGVKRFYFTRKEYLNLHVSLIHRSFICCKGQFTRLLCGALLVKSLILFVLSGKKTAVHSSAQCEWTLIMILTFVIF